MVSVQCLKRVFNNAIETCSECSGVKVIACIEGQVVNDKMITHWNEKVALVGTGLLAEVRASPKTGLCD